MSGFQDFVGSNSACAGINPTMQLVNQLDKEGLRKGKFPEQGVNLIPPSQAPPINSEQHKVILMKLTNNIKIIIMMMIVNI